MTTNELALSKDEVRLYHQQGWLGPYTLVSEEEMAGVRRRIDEEILEMGKAQGLAEKDYFHNRHLDNRCVYELLSHPNLVERAAALLGPHLVLWRTNFQIKAPLSEQEDWDTEVPWHQDCAYYQPSPNVILSAWIAVDETTKANGCMQVLPGSHKRLYPHIEDPDAEIFSREVDPSTFDASDAVDLELKPGEFIFFNESTLHYSPPNRSETRRFGITPRLTVPFVDVGRREQIDVLMVKGEDYMGFYNVVEPPDDSR
ncbi:MAG: phytanoyl-CoA dioxygenase family protein [Caldilineaceae bacterium]|nr:phytanoyl-CoA dioxygenase family protein [Caldilineaceae bacterium]